jgi:hypothetical protein
VGEREELQIMMCAKVEGGKLVFWRAQSR